MTLGKYYTDYRDSEESRISKISHPPRVATVGVLEKSTRPDPQYITVWTTGAHGVPSPLWGGSVSDLVIIIFQGIFGKLEIERG